MKALTIIAAVAVLAGVYTGCTDSTGVDRLPLDLTVREEVVYACPTETCAEPDHVRFHVRGRGELHVQARVRPDNSALEGYWLMAETGQDSLAYDLWFWPRYHLRVDLHIAYTTGREFVWRWTHEPKKEG